MVPISQRDILEATERILNGGHLKKQHLLHCAASILAAVQLAAAKPAWPPDTFSCYYGKITPEAVKSLENIDLVVVHPGDNWDNLDAQKISQLRKTGLDKTVIGYVTIGEDDKPPGGPPLKGEDTSGPSFVGSSLSPAKASNGYPARFLDQQKLVLGEDQFLKFGPDGKPVIEKGQDGHPDENGVWGSYYVRADDPQWRTEVFKKMDALVAMGADGFFLDTVDTASPWGDYGWTAPGMLEFVEAIRKRYPDKRIVGNRGLFYLTQSDRYAKAIDAVLFESVLTHYNWESDSGDISPWAKWHVKALDEEVAPACKRTGLHLLVLDYLNPEQEDALALVQSDRSLLQDIPHSLSFSHPSLQVTGWTAADLLPEPAPSHWPTLQKLEVSEGKPGFVTVKANFDSEIPKNSVPDLRITDRSEVVPKRAAQLPPAHLISWKAEGKTLTLVSRGLDKNQKYRAFLRLLSRSTTLPTDFGWTEFQTQSSTLPAQIKDVTTGNRADGVAVKFTADSALAESYRVYALVENTPKLLAEGKFSPVVLSHMKVGEVQKVYVVAVDSEGKEGYPSELVTAVRTDVIAPPAPGSVSVSQEGDTVTFSWESATEAESYRLYTVPEGKQFRLPLLTGDTEVEAKNMIPGTYKVYITAVDGAGNQSKPGPVGKVTIR